MPALTQEVLSDLSRTFAGKAVIITQTGDLCFTREMPITGLCKTIGTAPADAKGVLEVELDDGQKFNFVFELASADGVSGPVHHNALRGWEVRLANEGHFPQPSKKWTTTESLR